MCNFVSLLLAVIGRGGEQISRLQTESKCKIQMAPDSGGMPDRVCSLSGTRESIAYVENFAGSCHKRQKPQVPNRNSKTRKVANAKGLNRNTNLAEPNLYELWRLRLFSFGGYGLALAALALVVFGAIECPSASLPTDFEVERTYVLRRSYLIRRSNPNGT